MALLGNIIWFLTGGVLVGLIYLLGAIIFFPLFPFLWPLVKYSFWPFGKTPVSRSDLARYKEHEDILSEQTPFEQSTGTIRFLGNVLWVFTFGWLLAIVHLGACILNTCLFFLILTIPNIGAHWRLMGVAFRPFGRIIVPTALAKEIEVGSAKQKLGM
jgi:uncharacterized membrane protein YccF (DUF307 family)